MWSQVEVSGNWTPFVWHVLKSGKNIMYNIVKSKAGLDWTTKSIGVASSSGNVSSYGLRLEALFGHIIELMESYLDHFSYLPSYLKYDTELYEAVQMNKSKQWKRTALGEVLGR